LTRKSALGLLVELRIGHPRQQDDRDVGIVGEQLPRAREAFAVGQSLVEQDDLRAMLGDDRAHLLQGRGLEDPHGGAQAVFEPDRDQAARSGLVVDHQHLDRVGRHRIRHRQFVQRPERTPCRALRHQSKG
jgi:hypothetical protein